MSQNTPTKQSSKPAHPANPAQKSPVKSPVKSQGKPKEIDPDDNQPEKEDETAAANNDKDSGAVKGKRVPAQNADRRSNDDEEGADERSE